MDTKQEPLSKFSKKLFTTVTKNIFNQTDQDLALKTSPNQSALDGTVGFPGSKYPISPFDNIVQHIQEEVDKEIIEALIKRAREEQAKEILREIDLEGLIDL